MNKTRLASFLLITAGCVALITSLFNAPSGAVGGLGKAAGPPGNNGTVKIDGVPFDSHPDNQPHVGCSFEVDFYGFDAGQLFATVTFEAQPPTGRGVLLSDKVFIGEDDNSGGGSVAGLDAHRAYDLTKALASFTPQPQQGWHVKLTVNAQGSIGADVKHKVFWVSGCAAPSTTTTTSTTTSTTSTTAAPATTSTTPTTTAATVLGVEITRGAAPATVAPQVLGTTQAGPAKFARTGVFTGWLLLVGTGLLLTGAGLVLLVVDERRPTVLSADTSS